MTYKSLSRICQPGFVSPSGVQLVWVQKTYRCKLLPWLFACARRKEFEIMRHNEQADDLHKVAFPAVPIAHVLVVPCHRRRSFPGCMERSAKWPLFSTECLKVPSAEGEWGWWRTYWPISFILIPDNLGVYDFIYVFNDRRRCRVPPWLDKLVVDWMGDRVRSLTCGLHVWSISRHFYRDGGLWESEECMELVSGSFLCTDYCRNHPFVANLSCIVYKPYQVSVGQGWWFLSFSVSSNNSLTENYAYFFLFSLRERRWRLIMIQLCEEQVPFSETGLLLQIWTRESYQCI